MTGTSERPISSDLRSRALNAHDGVLPPVPHHPDVRGLVVDVPMDGRFATLMTLSDGTTSMYTSVGGGTIGAGNDARVRAASDALLTTVQQFLDAFEPTESIDHPIAGWVRMFVLTTAGNRRGMDVPEAVFWQGYDGPLMPVIAGTQELISALGLVSRAAD